MATVNVIISLPLLVEVDEKFVLFVPLWSNEIDGVVEALTVIGAATAVEVAIVIVMTVPVVYVSDVPATHFTVCVAIGDEEEDGVESDTVTPAADAGAVYDVNIELSSIARSVSLETNPFIMNFFVFFLEAVSLNAMSA